MNETELEKLIEVGQFYLLNKNYENAIEAFKKALKLKQDALIYYQMGIAYEGLNEWEKAKKMYRKSLELNPHLKEASEHLDKLVKK